jgi:hypothetical protein
VTREELIWCRTGDRAADATLDGSASTDEDSDALTYRWLVDEVLVAETATTTVSLGLGAHAAQLVVNDGECKDDDHVMITVADTTAPVVTDGWVSLWPPHHKYKQIDVTTGCGVVIEDVCQGPITPSADNVAITCVSSDEPEDVSGGGDGHTRNDIVIVDGTRVRVRAERQGGGNGRVYTIGFVARDDAGNEASGACRVQVVHDQAPAGAAVDDGVAYQVCR